MSYKLYSPYKQYEPNEPADELIHKAHVRDMDTAACSPKVQQVVEPYLSIFAQDPKIIPVEAEVREGLAQLWAILPKPEYKKGKWSMEGLPTDTAALLQARNGLMVVQDVLRLREDLQHVLENSGRKPSTPSQSVLLNSDYSLSGRAQFYGQLGREYNWGGDLGKLYACVLNPYLDNPSQSKIDMHFHQSWWEVITREALGVSQPRVLQLEAVPEPQKFIEMTYRPSISPLRGYTRSRHTDVTLPPQINETLSSIGDFSSNMMKIPRASKNRILPFDDSHT